MWGVYTNTRSAKIKRNGEHMQFKRKREAIEWIKDNESKYGGCNLFVRKISKRVV